VHKLEGVYHANTDNTDNATLMRTIAKVLGKKMWMPNAPAFAIRLLFGEMAVMVLKGVKTDNSKLRNTGFTFKHPELEGALRELWKR
jgi:NAD dependent epimerase/dehydratase family enzyme